ncbi:MAG: O-antigen ligase family protein, partial [Candidatus Omnitrophota bacterium]|nr:O-antigen ligase family protein [Candidatus Omnitrophota bacterium]
LRFLGGAVEYSVYGIIFSIPISITMIGTFAGMAIVFFLVKKILSPDFSSLKANKVLFLFLLAFFVFMDLSLLNSGPLVAKSLKVLLIKWGRFPLLLWAIIDTFQDTRRVVKAVCVFLFSAALVGLTVFTQKFFGFEFLRGRASGGFLVPSIGPFKNQNGLAAYLTSVIPIVLSFGLWKWKRITVKICFLVITAMLIISSFWTFCRGGWLGLIAGLIFVILVTNYHRIKKVFWLLFWPSYIFFVPLIGLALFFFRNRRDSNRFILSQGAWGMIKEHPLLGNGIGTFMDYCISYTNNFGVYYAHNCYLQIWAESGIFSLLCFILFVGYVFYRSIKVSLIMPRSLNYFILVGLTAGLLGFLVHSFFEVHLYSFQLSFLFWVVLGLTVALSSKLCLGRLLLLMPAPY